MSKLFSGIEYMQDMTSDICSAANENDSARLIDKRDGKSYWVTKLKDKNCWMTQNLAYSDGSTQTGTISGFSSTSSGNSSNNYIAQESYDPGLWVYTTPTNSSNNCGSSTGLTTCTEKGWVNVSGWTASENSSYTDAVDTTNKIYNAHYLAGNYYSWPAATAGTGLPSLTSGNAPGSICPAGWQLPVNSGDKSYSSLLTSYGTNSGLSYGTQDIRLAPLYFVYGGYVGSSSLSNAGEAGRYWSSTAANSTNAYALYFSTTVNPSYNPTRYIGISVRCVAR